MQRGLALIDSLAEDGSLDQYYLFHAAKADLLRRSGSMAEAEKSYECALELVTNASERRYLQRRLIEVGSPS
jgi:RNA polymerase sigma-70 factor, ECF subfamily